MQSLLFRAKQHPRLLFRCFSAIPKCHVNKQIGVSTKLNLLDSRVTAITHPVTYFHSSEWKYAQQRRSSRASSSVDDGQDEDWRRGTANNGGNANNNNDQDEQKRKQEQWSKTISLIFISGFFVYLNVSYLQEMEKLKRQMEEKERELEEEKKRKSGSVVAGTSTGAEPARARNREPRVKSTVLTWNEFVTDYLAKGNVVDLVANRKSELVLVRLKTPVEFANRKMDHLFMQIPPDMLENKLEMAQEELALENRVFIQYKDNDFVNNLLTFLLYGGIFLILFRFGRAAMNKMQSMQSDMMSKMTEKKFQVVDPHLKSGGPRITFGDVAGLHEAKIEIKEFVDYLRDPDRFKKLGAKVPKGALLTGPPGCGKTLLAKAVASEANVPFFNVAGTEFIEMIGGVGAQRVRSLFEEARKQSPSIIFIDEIDAIGRKRSDANQSTGGGSGEFDQTLNQLLVSMDGLESNSQVVVLASTNRADILDKALTRPGRLDRMIDIDLPTHSERIEMLNVHLRGLKLNFSGKDREEFLSQLAHLTPGFSGADLANICNESALMAARDGNSEVDKSNFYAALERVIAGAEKKNSIITVEDKKLIAYRECGKVIISWFHEYSDLILKVSLISRANMAAFSQFLPADKKLYSKDELFDQLCLQFGGKATEAIVFNQMTTSSEKDLKRVTQMAYAQVESLGMSDVIGHMSFPTTAEEKRGGMVGQKPYSRKLRNTIDLEVNKLLANAHNSTVKTLNDHMDKLHLLAAELIKRESLTYQEIVDLIGQPVNAGRYKTAVQPSIHAEKGEK